jgi:hypothetical protein
MRGIDIIHLEALIENIRGRAISKMNDQAERHQRTGSGAGGFVNNKTLVDIGIVRFGPRSLTTSRVDLGGESLQVEEQGWMLAHRSYTVAGVAVIPNEIITAGEIRSFADHSAILQAPIYVSTISYDFIQATRSWRFSIKETYRITGDGKGKLSCTNLSRGDNCL